MPTSKTTIHSPTISVFIAEDHELSRNGLVFSLEQYPRIKLLGTADNGKKALEQLSKRNPDVILMDIAMPVMDGIEATQFIKLHHPEIKVIMLTSHHHTDMVYASLAAGADAYCLKDIKMDRLVQVIEMVAEGAVWLDPAIAKMVMTALPTGLQNTPATKPAKSKSAYNTDLTEREHSVLTLIVDGKSNQEIADLLHITIHTAKAHVCNIIQKLAVDDRTQAAVKALREGLVDLD